MSKRRMKMGYSFIYLFCVLVLIMLALRIFLPIVIYLFPVLVIIAIVRILFNRRKTKQTTYEQTYYNQDSTYHQDTNYQNQYHGDPDIIDVDYKVVDEDENTH